MDLALIGNCSFQALINSQAHVQWLCLPRFDSSFVVGPLVDKAQGGEFSIEPAEDGFTVEQRYIEETAILETVWSRPGESFSVTDFAPRYLDEGSLSRPRVLVRKLRALEGRPSVRCTYEPVYDYGRSPAPKGVVQLQSSEAFVSGRSFELRETVYLALSWRHEIPGDLADACEEFLGKTLAHWRDWVRALNLPLAFRDEVIRSAITLKLHQYEDSGAITAAATTSIPEHADSGRNWDYRFCWPRDSYFTVDALQKLGSDSESRAYVAYLQEIARENKAFQPLYGIGGETRVEEEILSHLAGYQGDGPVRIGNQAYTQVQYDIFGEMLCAIEPIYRDAPSASLRGLVLRLLSEIDTHFEEPDAGLWEKRDEPARHTFSLLMHWLGGRAACNLGTHLDDAELLERGQRIMERARGCMDDECWLEEEGFYAETVGGVHADASLLFMISVGYLDATDARAHRHLEALSKRLQGEEGLFRRYVHDDGLGETHSSFTVCTLWYAEALAWRGELAEATRVLNSVLCRANHVGLLSEDIDPRTGTLWGNFPQTYSHVGIIRCALAMASLRGDQTLASTRPE